MPPKRVQEAYGSFMDSYVENFGDDIVPRAWKIVGDCREKIAKFIHAERPEEIAFVKALVKLAPIFPLILLMSFCSSSYLVK